jgi:subtilase family serine protease
MRCFALVRTDERWATPPQYRAVTGIADLDLAAAAAAGYYGPLGPPQIQQAYNLPSAKGGKGQTVALIDAYDDPTAETDLAAYRKQFGLPACTTANGCFQKLNEKGQTSPLPAANAGWAVEISVDLDMASAVCPNCHIVLVEADDNKTADLGKSVAIAAKAGAAQISNSYGGGECYYNSKGTAVCGTPAAYAKYYAIKNAIVTASSGDSDWFAGPQSPADFPTVVAVGGTSIYPYANKRGWLETGWTGAGSSCSKYIKAPSWIPPSVIKCAGGKRPIADVSAVADPFTGVLYYQTYPYKTGGYGVVGGTSVSSPITAAIYALAGNAESQNYGAKLYKAPSGSLTDVIIGKNGILGYKNVAGQTCAPVNICTVVPGWDGPTGNGTPWGVGAY